LVFLHIQHQHNRMISTVFIGLYIIHAVSDKVAAV